MLKSEYAFQEDLKSLIYKLIGIYIYVCIANLFILEIFNGVYYVIKKLKITNAYCLIFGTIVLGVIIYVHICFVINNIISKIVYWICAKLLVKVKQILNRSKLLCFAVYLLNKLLTLMIVAIFISMLWYAYRFETVDELKVHTNFEKIVVSIVNDITIADCIGEHQNEITLYNNTKLEDAINKLNDISNDVYPHQNEITLYNNTKLEDAIQSTEEIANKVAELMIDKQTSLDKAICIYNWIGTNISYDDKLAETMSTGAWSDGEKYSCYGARYAFDNLSGICFDFASLYVVMAKEAGLNVRLIIGDAYNGTTFGGHAWNQVYIEEEDRWINVDSTFWGATDAFDSDDFMKIHKERYAAGEW